MTAIEFVKDKLSHLKTFYKSEEAMVEHFLEKGENEVTIALHEVIGWIKELIGEASKIPEKVENEVNSSENTTTTTTTTTE